MRAKRPATTESEAGLTQDQERELTAWLHEGGFTSEEIEDVVWAINHWFPVIQARLREGAAGPLRRARRSKHFSVMASHAQELQKLLGKERPLWKTADIDWAAFDGALGRLIESAHEEAVSARPKEVKGRRPEEWRDELVALVHSLYPERVIAKRGGKAHRDKTVAKLLDFLDVEVSEVSKTVRDSLERAPRPPFVAKRV